MIKKLIYFIVIVFVLIVFVNLFANTVYATEAIDAMKDMKESGFDDTAKGKLGPIINTVIGFIQVIGTGISVIMVSFLGIKYMMAAPSDKADVKKQIIPMAIGALLLFASANIIELIAKVAVKLGN